MFKIFLLPGKQSSCNRNSSPVLDQFITKCMTEYINIKVHMKFVLNRYLFPGNIGKAHLTDIIVSS